MVDLLCSGFSAAMFWCVMKFGRVMCEGGGKAQQRCVRCAVGCQPGQQQQCPRYCVDLLIHPLLVTMKCGRDQGVTELFA